MKTTRRAAIAAIVAGASAARPARAAEKAAAYGLIGDRYHNSDYIRTALNRTIQKDLDVTIDFCDETENLTAETLRGYKMLIVLRDGMIWPDGYPDETTNAGFSPGHMISVLWNPEYVKLQHNAVRWLLRQNA